MLGVLVAALVGPFFIDWTAYRTTFEQYGERLLGHRVAVMGEAEMRLLPTPMLTFTDVRVGEPEDPLLAVSRFAVHVELTPLMKGEVRIIDMTLDRPDLNLSLDENGRLDWFTALGRDGLLDKVDPDQVLVEQARIIDGRVTVVDARNGASHRLDDVDITMSTRSLYGPYKIDGVVSHAGERATIMLATGRRDADGGIRLRAGVTPIAVPIDLVADGRVFLQDGAPIYEGRFDLASVTGEEAVDGAWESAGSFVLDIDRIALSEARFRYGPEDRPVALDGSADVIFTSPGRFDVRATAKQIDLDRITGRGPQNPVAAADAGELVLSALQALPHPPIDGTIAFDIPALVSGGGLTQDVRLEARRLASGWRIAELSGRFPGRSPFLVRGDLELAPEAAFRGSAAVAVEQPNVFADWWRQGVVLDAVVAPFAFESQIDASGSGVSLTDFGFEIAGHPGRGAITYRTDVDDTALFDLDIDADRLNADQVGLLARLFLGDRQDGGLTGFASGLQAKLQLYAEALEVGDLDASTIALRAAFENDVLTVDELNVADLAGAQINASGRIEAVSTAPSGKMSLEIDAERLGGVASLLQTLAPEMVGTALFVQAPDLFEPAKLSVVFEGETIGSGAQAGTRAQVTLDGVAGGTDVGVDVGLEGRLDDWRAASLDFEARFAAQSGADLMRQAGAPLVPVADLGAGRIEIGAAGIPEEGLEGHARLYLDQATLGGVGTITLPANAPVEYAIDAVAKADDLLPFVLLTGRLPSLASSMGAVDLVATVNGAGDSFRVERLSGSLVGTAVEADLEVDLRHGVANLDPQVRGALVTSHADPAAFADLLLGADQLTGADGGSWSRAAFGPPLVSGVDLAVDVTAERVRLAPAPDATSVTAALGVKADRLTFDISQGDFAGGRLSGTFAVSRSEGQAGITTSVRVEDASLQDLVWRRNARPVATGRTDISLDIEGQGRSLSGIVSSLSGGGTLTVRDGDIRSLNPEAFDLVIRAADAGLELEDETVRAAFASHLDAGRLPFSALEASATISGGVARINNVSLDNLAATVFGNARIDLDARTLDSDFSLEVDPGGDAVAGAEPEVGLIFSGPLTAPSRTIDIAPFTAFLTLRAFEQEVQRIEKLQAEIDAQELRMDNLRQLFEWEKRREEAKRRLPGDLERPDPVSRSATDEIPPEPQPTPSPAAPTPAPVVAPVPAPAPAPEPQVVSPAEGFQDRIRSALEELDRSGRINPVDVPDGQPLQLLPPLDPPVFIEIAPDQ